MPYTEQEIKRLLELHQAIEARKEHPHAAPTYQDVPALQEAEQLLLSRTDTDPETLEDKIAVLDYLAGCYDSLCRPAVSAKLYGQLLSCHVALSAQRPYDEEARNAFEYALYMAVKTRNRYRSDSCEDLLELVSASLPRARIAAKVEEALQACRWQLKHDPVEATEAYLAMIDEVEALVDAHKTMDFCLEAWSLKAMFLAERGISWKSPAQLNPGTMFD